MKNQTTFNRAPKDSDHPYNKLSAKLYKLPLNELNIMQFILCNNDDWIVNRREIYQRLHNLGMSDIRFRKAWMSLQKKHYLICKRFRGGVHWFINEDPYNDVEAKQELTIIIPMEKDIHNQPLKHIDIDLSYMSIPDEELNERQKMIKNANFKHYGKN